MLDERGKYADNDTFIRLDMQKMFKNALALLQCTTPRVYTPALHAGGYSRLVHVKCKRNSR